MPDPIPETKEGAPVGAGVEAATAPPPTAAPPAVIAPPTDAGEETRRPVGASSLSADKIEETYGISDAEYAVLLKTVCKNAPREIAAFFMLFCKRRRLDPFSKQVYLWPDKTDDEGKPVIGCNWNIVTGIDGFRSIATRNPLYRGQSRPKWEYWTTNEGQLMEFEATDSKYKKIAGKPRTESCEVSVFRAIADAPTDKNLYLEFVGIALFDEFVKRDFGGKIYGNWEVQPDHQLRTRAEVMALRMAFPEDVGSLYLEEELRDRRDDEPTPRAGVPTATDLNDEERTVVDDEIDAAATELGITKADLFLRGKAFTSKVEFLAHLVAEVEKKNETRRNKRDVGATDEAIDVEHRPIEETAKPSEPVAPEPILVKGKKPCSLCKSKPGQPHAEGCPAPIADEDGEEQLPL